MARKTAHQRGYGYRWRKERLHFLDQNPLCKFCEDEGKVTAATVVDHITPHKGDEILFWDVDNWQPLCEQCHNSTKALIENGKDMRPVGLDGWRVDE